MGVLKYDQWHHHWACVLTALQKCKAESDYYYYYKLLTYHTEIPDFPPQRTGIRPGLGCPGNSINLQRFNTNIQQHTSIIAKSEQRAHAAQQIAHGAVLGTAPEKLIDPKT